MNWRYCINRTKKLHRRFDALSCKFLACLNALKSAPKFSGFQFCQNALKTAINKTPSYNADIFSLPTLLKMRIRKKWLLRDCEKFTYKTLRASESFSFHIELWRKITILKIFILSLQIPKANSPNSQKTWCSIKNSPANVDEKGKSGKKYERKFQGFFFNFNFVSSKLCLGRIYLRKPFLQG